MTRRGHVWLTWVGLVVLLLLHLDFWRPQRALLYFGWLPEELAWRLGWILLAFLYLLYFCAYFWVEEED